MTAREKAAYDRNLGAVQLSESSIMASLTLARFMASRAL